LRQEQQLKIEIRHIAIKSVLAARLSRFHAVASQKSIGVKVSPILFAKVSVLLSAIL